MHSALLKILTGVVFLGRGKWLFIIFTEKKGTPEGVRGHREVEPDEKFGLDFYNGVVMC